MKKEGWVSEQRKKNWRREAESRESVRYPDKDNLPAGEVLAAGCKKGGKGRRPIMM